jgi:outer membrane protein OmpA-like peptidoglycan-associated protein
MWRRTLRFLGALTALAMLSAWPDARAAAPVIRDHALVQRFPGAQLVRRQVRPLDEYWMPLGRLVGEGQAEKFEMLEGKWTHFDYAGPASASVVEIAKHYETTLLKAGFDTLYACKDEACGEGGRKTNDDWWSMSERHRFLVARISRPTGDVWVSVHAHAKNATTPGEHEVDIIETRKVTPPRRDTTSVVSAEFLAQELGEKGHVQVPTIEFEGGGARLTPASSAALAAIADLLTRQPELRLNVVVHTEQASDVQASLQLSRRRAAALIDALTKRYGAPVRRLRPEGVGPLAPVAANRTDEDRARNRRVELVPY